MLGSIHPWVALRCRAVTIGTELRFLVFHSSKAMLFQAQAQPAAREWNTEIESELFRISRQLVSQCDFMAVESNKKFGLCLSF